MAKNNWVPENRFSELNLTKHQEIAIASLMQSWVGYEIQKTESNYVLVKFDDDEQTQCYRIYNDGKSTREW